MATEEPRCDSFSPDGNALILVDNDNVLRAWEFKPSLWCEQETGGRIERPVGEPWLAFEEPLQAQVTSFDLGGKGAWALLGYNGEHLAVYCDVFCRSQSCWQGRRHSRHDAGLRLSLHFPREYIRVEGVHQTRRSAR